MNTPNEKLSYPETAYYDIFGGPINVPPDAEELLKYVLGTLSEQESELFMLRYKDNMTFQEIGEQVIATTLRRLRHPSRSRVLIGKDKPEN